MCLFHIAKCFELSIRICGTIISGTLLLLLTLLLLFLLLLLLLLLLCNGLCVNPFSNTLQIPDGAVYFIIDFYVSFRHISGHIGDEGRNQESGIILTLLHNITNGLLGDEPEAVPYSSGLWLTS